MKVIRGVLPAQELTQVVAVPVHGGGREVVALQLAPENRRANARLSSDWLAVLCAMPSPALDPGWLSEIQRSGTLYYTQGLLRAMFQVTNAVKTGVLPPFFRKSTPIRSFWGR